MMNVVPVKHSFSNAGGEKRSSEDGGKNVQRCYARQIYYLTSLKCTDRMERERERGRAKWRDYLQLLAGLELPLKSHNY